MPTTALSGDKTSRGVSRKITMRRRFMITVLLVLCLSQLALSLEQHSQRSTVPAWGLVRGDRWYLLGLEAHRGLGEALAGRHVMIQGRTANTQHQVVCWATSAFSKAVLNIRNMFSQPDLHGRKQLLSQGRSSPGTLPNSASTTTADAAARLCTHSRYHSRHRRLAQVPGLDAWAAKASSQEVQQLKQLAPKLQTTPTTGTPPSPTIGALFSNGTSARRLMAAAAAAAASATPPEQSAQLQQWAAGAGPKEQANLQKLGATQLQPAPKPVKISDLGSG